jgi:hypothetical protein
MSGTQTAPSPAPVQHIIPKHYLKGFADSPERTHVWVYNKGLPYSTGNEINRRNPFRQAIKSAGAAPGIYRLVTLTGEQLDEDPTITKQEAWGVEVLRKLRARAPISAEDKVHFSFYIDLMRARVPAGMTHALPFVKKAMMNFNWKLLRRLAAEEGRFGLARKFDPDVPEYVAAIEQDQLLRGVTVRSPGIVKQLAGMTWLFFTVDGDRFFPTTDNPAFFPPGLGLAMANGFIIMPIDSQMVLLVCNLSAADRQYVPASPEQYSLFRNLILAGATEKAYACRNEPEILDMLNNPRLPA